MKIQKAKLPLKDGVTYYLPIIFEESMEPLAEGGGVFSTPGGRTLILSPKSVRALREEAKPCLRCKDCTHAVPSGLHARNVSCDYQYPDCSWDKMSKACEHFQPRKVQSNEN